VDGAYRNSGSFWNCTRRHLARNTFKRIHMLLLLPEGERITLSLKNTRPVDLMDLSEAFDGFAREYHRSVQGSSDPGYPNEVSLYVTEIHSGSIIAELAPLAPYALPLMENTNTVVDFCKNLKAAFDWLRGEGDKPEGVEAEQLENVEAIVRPVVKDTGSQLNIVGGVSARNLTIMTGPVSIVLDHSHASKISDGARRELALISRRKAGLHEMVVLQLYQARNDPKSKSGDRGIIESVQKQPVRVIFNNQGVKAKMLSGIKNPFKQAYLVDVSVETMQDRPVIYRIVEFHEVIKQGR